MTTPFLDFNLAVEPVDAGRRIAVKQSPVGTVHAPFDFHLGAGDVARFWSTIGLTDDQEQAAEPGAVVREWGARLFKALFPAPVDDYLRGSLLQAYQQRASLRIHLQFDHVTELTYTPWEYLYDPVRNESLALSPHSPLARHVPLMHQIEPLVVKPPLRMLVVIPNPAGRDRFNADRRWLALLDSLDYLAADGVLLLERLQSPTLFDLQRRLRKGDVHILHFLGHAAHQDLAGDGLLLFEDTMGRGRGVSGQHLGSLLRDHDTLRLVVLEGVDPFDGKLPNPMSLAARHLIQRNLPAVVTMPWILPEILGLSFMHQLYVAVVAREPVDVAVAKARLAMTVEGDRALWGVPQLFVRCRDGRLFVDERVPRQQIELPADRQPSLLQRVLGLRLGDDSDRGRK